MARPTAVHYGAGSIGRGFLGQLLAESGYEVVFIDVQPDLVDALNVRREYPLRLVSREGQRQITVAPVRAVDGRDEAAVMREIAGAEIISTAVGGAIMPRIAGPLAEGLKRRIAPVNLLICENIPDPAGTVRDLLVSQGGAGLSEAIKTRIGLVACVVSRMVPLPDPHRTDPLEVVAEPYARLPVDAGRIVGEVPHILGLEPKENFGAYVRLKLFVHNAAHAAVAYAAYPRGYATIHEAMEDREIAGLAAEVMRESSEALHRAEGLPPEYLETYCRDLLERFRNPYLGDTVERVGRDPARKLGPDERLIGAAKLCMEQEIEPHALLQTIHHALQFNPPGDPSAPRIQALLAERGVSGVLEAICGLPAEAPLAQSILKEGL